MKPFIGFVRDMITLANYFFTQQYLVVCRSFFGAISLLFNVQIFVQIVLPIDVLAILFLKISGASELI